MWSVKFVTLTETVGKGRNTVILCLELDPTLVSRLDKVAEASKKSGKQYTIRTEEAFSFPKAKR